VDSLDPNNLNDQDGRQKQGINAELAVNRSKDKANAMANSLAPHVAPGRWLDMLSKLFRGELAVDTVLSYTLETDIARGTETSPLPVC
jgi:hypothetical protein